ncbi:hypothetical protein SAMN06264346_114100 [Chryseobacterium profundimaris]|uniref:Uncharacterized protein n=1 Tax=Chryseobacterium profundimaris TaxID=1387275 RepID=A0ABY1PE78_9FLAO|nr:hypothetical protein SAMN06264346_114100 [Chryseobacterium profundimaris]
MNLNLKKTSIESGNKKELPYQGSSTPKFKTEKVLTFIV